MELKIRVEHYLDGYHEYNNEQFEKFAPELNKELESLHKLNLLPVVGDIISNIENPMEDWVFYKVIQRTVTTRGITFWVDDLRDDYDKYIEENGL